MVTLFIYKRWLEKQWSDYQIIRYTNLVWALFLLEITTEFIATAIILNEAGIVI